MRTPEQKKHADYMRKWRAENPEKAKNIECRRSNTSERKIWRAKYNRQYYAKHAEELRQYQRNWRSDGSNTVAQTRNKMKYRQRKNSLPDTLTEDEWQEILEKYHHLCAYCGTGTEPLYEEHWIPVSRGGGRTKENIVPSCHRCNSRKGTMTGDEFLDLLDLEKQGYVVSLIGVDK